MLEKLLSIFDWAKDKLPIQDRKERWRNELDNFIKEREELKKGKCDEKKALRLDKLNNLIAQRQQWLRNQTEK